MKGIKYVKTTCLFGVMFCFFLIMAIVAGCGGPALETPSSLEINYDSLTLTWDKVDGAQSYVVGINDITRETDENSYSLEQLSPGDYILKVMAVGGSEGRYSLRWSEK